MGEQTVLWAFVAMALLLVQIIFHGQSQSSTVHLRRMANRQRELPAEPFPNVDDFKWYEVPAKGEYVVMKVEQNGQLVQQQRSYLLYTIQNAENFFPAEIPEFPKDYPNIEYFTETIQISRGFYNHPAFALDRCYEDCTDVETCEEVCRFKLVKRAAWDSAGKDDGGSLADSLDSSVDDDIADKEGEP